MYSSWYYCKTQLKKQTNKTYKLCSKWEALQIKISSLFTCHQIHKAIENVLTGRHLYLPRSILFYFLTSLRWHSLFTSPSFCFLGSQVTISVKNFCTSQSRKCQRSSDLVPRTKHLIAWQYKKNKYLYNFIYLSVLI